MALANFKSGKFKFSKEAALVSHARFGVLLRVVRAEHQNQELRRIPFSKKRLLKRPFQTNLHQGLSVDIKKNSQLLTYLHLHIKLTLLFSPLPQNLFHLIFQT